MTNKQKYFYSHLVEIESIIVELNQMDIGEKEKQHLLSLAESNLHHVILESILSELSEEDKKIFLVHLALDEHDKIWHHLKGKIENIEEKIKTTGEELKKELHKDIDDSKKIPH